MRTLLFIDRAVGAAARRPGVCAAPAGPSYRNLERFSGKARPARDTPGVVDPARRARNKGRVGKPWACGGRSRNMGIHFKSAWALVAILSLFGGGAYAQPASGKPQDSDLAAEFDQAVKVFMDEYRAADEKTRAALLDDPVREPRHRFTPLFRAAAERHLGKAEALPFWSWLVDNGSIVDAEVGEIAVRRLLADHLSDPGLAPAVRAIGRAADRRGADRTIADLTRIFDRSPHSRSGRRPSFSGRFCCERRVRKRLARISSARFKRRRPLRRAAGPPKSWKP